MRFLFVVDPVELLELAGDTSFALMLECAARGHAIWTCQPGHLGLEHDCAVANAQPTGVRAALSTHDAFDLGERQRHALGFFDAVMMRKDPPLNVEYLQATWLLERARGTTLLVNDPRGLRELNEHLSILAFPDLTPPTIVTRDRERLQRFLMEHQAIVVKPLDGFGGLGIFVVRVGDPNRSSIFETATQVGRTWTMAQQYLPAAVEGDKRIVLVDGDPIGAVLRVPPPDEARGNLHVGGAAQRAPIDEADRKIIARLAPTLREYGQLLVGLDVIGGMLTEINITSPTGIRHLDELEGINSAAQVIDCVERHV